MRRLDALLLSLLALAVRVTGAIAWPNQLWPDEIFQSLEQAHRLVFGYGVVPWEFRVGARSWLLAGALAPAMKVGGWVACAIVLSVLSLAPVLVAYRLAARAEGRLAGWVAGIACAGWFELVYFAPKALSEAVAAHLFVLALLLVVEGRRAVLVAGALVGLTCALRIQMAPAALVLVWVTRSRRVFVAAAAGAFALAGLVDVAAGYAPFHALWENARINLLEHRSQRYGTAPAWAYLLAMGRVWSWMAPPLVVLAWLGRRPGRAALACAGVLVVVHSVLSHKEYRFMYPAITLVVVVAAVGAGRLVTRVRERRRPWVAAGVLIGWTLGSVQVGRAWSTETTTLALQLAPHSRQFDHLRGGLVGLSTAGRRPDLCGVALVGVPWFLTGGYTWLGRDVPIYMFDPDKIEQGSANSAIAWSDRELPPPFERAQCWGGICLWQRAGGCAAQPGYHINEVLKAADQ